jgi:hypothetical protein
MDDNGATSAPATVTVVSGSPTPISLSPGGIPAPGPGNNSGGNSASNPFAQLQSEAREMILDLAAVIGEFSSGKLDVGLALHIDALLIDIASNPLTYSFPGAMAVFNGIESGMATVV